MVEIEVIDCMNDIINQVVKKEEKRLYDIQYREKNKEKMKEKQRLAYKKWYEKNREKILEQKKEYKKKYDQTEQGIKTRRISNWKYKGVVCDNYEQLYNHYLKTAFCDACKVKLTYDKNNTSTTKCLDHCHQTGLFRNILCNSCNIKRRESNF